MTDQTHLRALPPPSGRRQYDDAFRGAALEQLRGGRPIAQVARDIGVARNTLKAWAEEAEAPPESRTAPVVTGNLTGTRREVLQALKESVAGLIARGGLSGRDMPANARLLMEISRDLEVLDARQEADDETGVVEDAPFNPEEI